MKTAIYIEDGAVQLVLTPESSFEKNALGAFAQKPMDVKIHQGQFYDCQGGWTRQRDFNPNGLASAVPLPDESVIMRIEEAKPQPATLPERR